MALEADVEGEMGNLFESRDEAQRYEAHVLLTFGSMNYPSGPLYVGDRSRYSMYQLLPLIEGQRWWMVPPSVLDVWKLDFNYLEPEAWAYFLPAFLSKAALVISDHDLISFTYWKLYPRGFPILEPENQGICKLFDIEQRKLILKYVEDYLEDGGGSLYPQEDNRDAVTLAFWREVANA
jgi:hypothetical protein